MPLSSTQLDTVEFSIDHLIDPPNNEQDFANYERLLFNLFTEQTPADENTKTLWNCFNHPDEFFLNLEKLGPPITFGEVKTAILDVIMKKFKESGYAINAWDKLAIVAHHHQQPAWQERFATKQSQPDNHFNLLDLETDEATLFNGEIGLDTVTHIEESTGVEHTLLWPYVAFSVLIPNEPESSHKLRLEIPIEEDVLRTQVDQYEYFTAINQFGFSAAEIHSAIVLIKYLKSQGIKIPEYYYFQEDLSDETQPYLTVKPAASVLITNKHYFQMLLNRSITLEEIYQVNEELAFLLIEENLIKCIQSNIEGLRFNELITYNENEITTLSKPLILQLIKQKILTVDQAKSLTKPELKIFTHPTYYNKLLSNDATAQLFLNISEQQASLFMIPVIDNLIQQNKLAPEQVLLFPLYAKQVFMCPTYQMLIHDGKMDPQEIGDMNESQCRLLINSSIRKQFANGSLTAKDITSISAKKIQSFMSSELLCDWLKQSHLDISDIKAHSDSSKITAYLKGLTATLLQSASLPEDQETQNIMALKGLLRTINQSANECGVQYGQFVDRFALYLVTHLSQSLIKLDTTNLKPYLEPLLSKLAEFLREKSTSDNAFWVSTYDEAAQLARLLITKIRLLPYQEINNKATGLNTKLIDDNTHQLKSICNSLQLAGRLMGHTLNQRLHVNPTMIK